MKKRSLKFLAVILSLILMTLWMSCKTCPEKTSLEYTFPEFPSPDNNVFPAVIQDNSVEILQKEDVTTEYTAVVVTRKYWKELVSYLMDIETIRILLGHD